MKKNKYGLMAGVGIGVILAIGGISVASIINNNKQKAKVVENTRVVESNNNENIVASSKISKQASRQKNSSKSNDKLLCQGQFPNGEYTGKFDIKADNELGYYTEYLNIEDGKITIFPTFNGQSLGMDFDIEADNIKIECK